MPNPMTRSDLNILLKEVYGDQPTEQLNNEVKALTLFEKSETAQWSGKVFVEALHTGRNHSTKAVAESGRLPNPKGQSYDEMRVTPMYLYGGIKLTAQIMKSATSQRDSFLSALDSEVAGMIQDMRVAQNRMIWGYGVGTLALVNEDNTGGETTISVDAPGGVAGSVNGARFLQVGMDIAFHAASPSDNVPLAIRTITAVDRANSTITVASVDETTAPENGLITAGVTRGGVSEGSWNLEPEGILSLIDDGTFKTNIHGVDRTTSPGDQFKCNAIASVGLLDELVLHRAFDMCDEVSGYEPTHLLAHHSVHREYISIAGADRRYTGDAAMRPDLGIKGGGPKRQLDFSGIPIEKERFAPYGYLFGVDTAAAKIYEQVAGEWIDEDGAILFRDGNIDAFEAQYRIFRNFGMLRCNSSFRLSGISANVDVVNVM